MQSLLHRESSSGTRYQSLHEPLETVLQRRSSFLADVQVAQTSSIAVVDFVDDVVVDFAVGHYAAAVQHWHCP